MFIPSMMTRNPVMAAPMPTPMNPFSQMGVSSSRRSPYFLYRS